MKKVKPILILLAISLLLTFLSLGYAGEGRDIADTTNYGKMPDVGTNVSWCFGSVRERGWPLGYLTIKTNECSGITLDAVNISYLLIDLAVFSVASGAVYSLKKKFPRTKK